MRSLNEELLKKYMRRKKLTLIADIILIILILGIGIYVWQNIEYAKVMGGDPCGICEDKTGGKCISLPAYSRRNTLFNKTMADELMPRKENK